MNKIINIHFGGNMLKTPEILRILRTGNYDHQDVMLCYDAAIALGYTGETIIEYIHNMLRLIKTEELVLKRWQVERQMQNSRNALLEANNVVDIRSAIRGMPKSFVRDGILAMQMTCQSIR